MTDVRVFCIYEPSIQLEVRQAVYAAAAVTEHTTGELTMFLWQ